MRSFLVCLMLLAAPVGGAFADDLADIRAATDARLMQADGSMRCFPDVKGPAEVYVFDMLGSGDVVSTTIKTERPVRYSDIVVEATDKPVLLALYNYYETVWRLKLKPGARVAGVWINGYERASVVGLPDDASIGRHYDIEGANKGAPECGLKPGELSRRDWALQRDALKREVVGARAQVDAATAASDAAREIYIHMPSRSESAVVEVGGQALLMAMNDEIDRLTEIADKASEALAAFEKAQPAWPPEEDPHLTSVNTAMKLWGAENRLKKHGPWPVVYAEPPITAFPLPSAYIVSSAKARDFQAAKAKARAELDALPGPDLPPIKPADGAKLLVPGGTSVDDALGMMIAGGYAAKNGPMQKYLNDALHLQIAAVGMPAGDRSAWLNVWMDLRVSNPVLMPVDVYTLLGPVVLTDCATSSEMFYLPDGVPDPEGCQNRYSRYFREGDVRLRKYPK